MCLVLDFFFLAYFLSFPTALDAALGFVGAQRSTHSTFSSQSARAIAAPGALLQRALYKHLSSLPHWAHVNACSIVSQAKPSRAELS